MIACGGSFPWITLAGFFYRPSISIATPRVLSAAELRRIRAPVLLLVGDHEGIYKPASAIRRATRLLTGLKAEPVPNANQTAQYTAPDLVNAKILRFLTG